MICLFLNEDGGKVDEEGVAGKGKRIEGEDEGETD